MLCLLPYFLKGVNTLIKAIRADLSFAGSLIPVLMGERSYHHSQYPVKDTNRNIFYILALGKRFLAI